MIAVVLLSDVRMVVVVTVAMVVVDADVLPNTVAVVVADAAVVAIVVETASMAVAFCLYYPVSQQMQ